MNWHTGASQFLQALSSPAPTPGGGAAAAMSGAMGCALMMMAVGTTLKRKNTPTQHLPILEQGLAKLGGLHSELKNLIQKDAQAYETYLAACKLPKENIQARQDALWFAATVPADTATVCLHVLKEITRLQDYIAAIILSDVACARHLLQSAIACCVENIRTNAAYITQADRVEKLQKQLETFTKSR